MHLFKPLLLLLVIAITDAFPIINNGYMPTEILKLSQELNKMQLGNCSNINATLPLDKTDPKLPAPSDGLSLKYVVLGRGTQNYTCACDEGSKPEAVGALATLFDASCLINYYPNLLHELPDAVINAPVEALAYFAVLTGQQASPDTGGLITGKHYFNSEGVPLFDLRFSGTDDWMPTELDSKAPPPSKGSSASGNGEGQNVAWLKLTSTGGHGVKVSIFLPLI